MLNVVQGPVGALLGDARSACPSIMPAWLQWSGEARWTRRRWDRWWGGALRTAGVGAGVLRVCGSAVGHHTRPMLTFRSLPSEDLRAAAELHAGSGSSGYRGMVSDECLDGSRLPPSRRPWRHRLARDANDALSLGAFMNEQMTALLVLEVEYDAERGAPLHTLHLRSDHRGTRIAQALIREAAIRAARAHGHRPFHLRVVGGQHTCSEGLRSPWCQRGSQADGARARWEPDRSVRMLLASSRPPGRPGRTPVTPTWSSDRGGARLAPWTSSRLCLSSGARPGRHPSVPLLPPRSVA